MRTRILRLAAAIAIVAGAACSSSMEQTALPSTYPQQAAPPPSAAESDRASESDSDAAPVSKDEGADDASATADAATKTPAAPAAPPSDRLGERFVCRHPAAAGQRACDAIVRKYAGGSPSCHKSVPYCASDLQAAYGLAQSAKGRGKGQTVAAVVAYGYPGAASDLAIYRKAMGLPPCTPGSGCLKIVNQNGATAHLPRPNSDANDDWRPEAALDIEMLSAICPNCKILLVQTNSNKNSDLDAGVNAAVALGAVAVGNSYSAKEENASDGAYGHAGRAITASAGNEGTGAREPCSYSGVVCVGGTSLSVSSRGWSERAWGSTGSGCSAYVPKPQWQHTKGCAMRSEVDVSAVGDPDTGVAFYESAGGGWQQAGGTSAAAQIVAAAFALGPSSALTNAPQWIWRHGGSSAYRDVISGSNGECALSFICHARAGYDGPTGWGTPQRIAGF